MFEGLSEEVQIRDVINFVERQNWSLIGPNHLQAQFSLVSIGLTSLNMSQLDWTFLTSTNSMIFINGTADREPKDYVEIVALSTIILLGLILNTGVFIQLMRQSKIPTASTSFLTGPYQRSSFTLFKKHLCLTDFAILLGHALGKVIWLYTLNWEMGGVYGCKIYQFLSAFTYYSNSNVVVAIGLDRLKVVYTSHIQGATSVRRVRGMLAVAWTLAAVCSIPQLYVWQTVNLLDGAQCTTIWQVATFFNQSSPVLDWTHVFYEMSHQAMVFFIPFLTLLSSYLLIVVRVLHYTLHPVSADTHRRGQTATIRVSPPNASEQRLLSSSMETLPNEYYQFAMGETTEMKYISDMTGPHIIVEKKKSGLRLYLSRLRRQWDCLLAGQTFSERIIEKRKAVCCGSVRACCLNAETANVNFRPLGLRKEHAGSPVWRRQLRSRIFITSLAIVTTHFLLWLPYNLLNITKFLDAETHAYLTDRGAHLLEDLIVLNSVLNPILYAYEPK